MNCINNKYVNYLSLESFVLNSIIRQEKIEQMIFILFAKYIFINSERLMVLSPIWMHQN